MKRNLKFKLNGRPVALDTDDQRALLWVLRGDLELTGTKYGCGEGVCGACTVAVDGVAMRSCQTPIASVEGKSVVTIEGLERDGKLHPLQQAFIDHGAFQCGYCTSGMLMSAQALLERNPSPSRSEIREALAGNLCRYTGYLAIIDAVELAAERMRSAA